jgi:hypothetical protein
VSSVRVIIAVSVALVGAGVVPAVHGQEAKQPPDIRMLLTQPQGRVTPDATSAPDLRDLPRPKMDKPPVEPPITIVVGDPRCYPGEEDGLANFGQLNRRRRH